MSSPAGYGYSNQQQQNPPSRTKVQYASPQQPVPSPYAQQPVPSPSKQPVPSPSQQPMPSPSYQPQPAPYQGNKRGGSGLNPCCCCKGSCNLRLNCIVIAIISIILGFLCCLEFIDYPESAKTEAYTNNCKLLLEHPAYAPYPESIDECKQEESLRSGMLATLIIGILGYIAGGIILLIAIFGRIKVCAFLAGGLILVGALFMFIATILKGKHEGVYVALYPQFVIDQYKTYITTYSSYKKGQEAWEGICYTPVPFAIIVGLVMVYAAVCCIALGMQISAGTDLDPMEGGVPPAQGYNPVAAPPSYGAPPAYGAYGGQAQTSPSSTANNSPSAQKLKQ